MNLSIPRKYLFVFSVLAVAGFFLAFRFLDRSVPPSEVPVSPPEAEEVSEDSAAADREGEDQEPLPPGWESYTGIIYPLGVSIYMQGTHKLVTSEGELILLLEASDEKLVVSESMLAEVQGSVRRTTEGNQKIMRVEKIIFR